MPALWAIVFPPEEILQDWAARKKGSKVALCRFMGAIRVGAERLGTWHLNLLECLYFSLVTGKLTAEKYQSIAAQRPQPNNPGDVEGAEGSTMTRSNDELKRLRNMCDNTLMLATVFFSDEENRMRQVVLTSAAEVSQQWQGKANKACRSIHESRAHMQDACAGFFLESCNETIKALSDEGILEKLRVVTPPSGLVLRDLRLHHPVVRQSLELSGLFANLIVSLVSHRLRKFLGLVRGWPERLCLLAHPQPEVRKQCMMDFRIDYEVFLKMSASGAAVKEMVRRSVFNLVSVQQYVQLCKVEKWECTARVRSFAARASARLVQTQVSEDGFNRQRRQETLGRTKRVSDERAWCALIKTEVLHTTHHFKAIPWRLQHPPRGAPLPRRLWQHKLKDISDKRFLSLVAKGRAASWYSPGPQNLCQAIVDLDIARHCERHHLWGMVDNAWLSCLVGGDPLLVRHSSWDEQEWVLSLGQFGGQAAYGWPVVQRAWSGKEADLKKLSQCYFELSTIVKSFGDLRCLVVLSEEEWFACRVDYVSPLAQRVSNPKVDFTGLVDLIRLSPVGEAMSLLEVVAGRAFAGLSKQMLSKLSAHLGVSSGSSSTLFEQLWALVGKALPKKSDHDKVNILKSRACEREVNVDELLGIGDAIEILDKADQKDYKGEAKAAKINKDEVKQFKKQLKSKRHEVQGSGKRGARGAKPPPLARRCAWPGS